MRAMRFAAQLDFQISDKTAAAMHEERALLGNIAAERIAVELNKLLTGKNVSDILKRHVSVLLEIIPELAPAINFKQNNPYHCFDVFTHILYSVDNAPEEALLRLTMLLHDIEKPACYTEDEDGTGHFHGHQQKSMETARSILRRLKYDNETVSTVTQLILHHDAEIKPESRNIKRWLNRIGEDRFRQLLLVKYADSMAQAEIPGKQKRAGLIEITKKLNEIIEQKQCFTLKDLAVDGRDMIALGISDGTRIGTVLNRLVEMVIEDKIKNEKETLLREAERYITEQVMTEV